ncbi:biotin transporter BioY [Pectinatus brassicae]|uniref:Biotin transporter n=1 Tax=Pectinatus brassicae TaxID=862415 RepID=A0A840UMF6_9FIRM|nr:biotin transporter BioY [Pectinatus brassicae]MBB5337390.1 biotin transport system substrate-specific component [Pectinatus brassicae]
MNNKNNNNLFNFVYSALFAALIIVLGFISIPIGPVPISGISLGVMLAGAVLSVRQAVYSILIVILLGAAGLPVFSGFTGGIGILLGPRGGYYLGFLLGVGIISLLRGNNNNTFRLFAAIFTGSILIEYIIAIPWLLFITQMHLKQAIWLGMLPFLPGDILKTILATILAKALYKNIPALRRYNE